MSERRPALPPEPLTDPEEIRRVVDSVLARPEYAQAAPGPLQRAFDHVLEALARAFDAAAATGAGRLAGVLVLVALAAVLAWVVARAVRRIRWDGREVVEVVGPAGRSPDDWLDEAAERERHGDLRAALRCHYRALVAWLGVRGVLDEVPGTTTGEYRRVVERALPEAAEAFADVTAAFERAWYGQRPVTADALAAAAGAAGRVRDAAAQAAAA